MPYEFTVEGFNAFSEDILKAEGDQATLTTLLADMNGTITDAIAKDVAATKEVETVTAENDRLRKANMTLFLRVGEKVDTEQNKSNGNKDGEENPLSVDNYMKNYFDSLDKEKK